MRTLCYTLAAAVVSCFGLNAPVQAQTEAPAVPFEYGDNAIEMVNDALVKLVKHLGSPEMTSESAVEAFKQATISVRSAMGIAMADMNKARRQLDEYNKAGKGNALDDLMDGTSSDRLQKMLRSDKKVQDAFVEFISALGTFDRLLNGDL